MTGVFLKTSVIFLNFFNFYSNLFILFAAMKRRDEGKVIFRESLVGEKG